MSDDTNNQDVKDKLQRAKNLRQDVLSDTKVIMKFDDGMEVVQQKKDKNYYLRDAKGVSQIQLTVSRDAYTNKDFVSAAGDCTNPKLRPHLLEFIEAKKLEPKDGSWSSTFGDSITGSRLGVIHQGGHYYDAFNLPKGFVVKGNLDLSGMGLTELPDLSTVTVKGNFYCGNNQLTTLKGAPKKVGERVYCDDNKLVSLLDMPKCKKFCSDLSIKLQYSNANDFENSQHVNYEDLIKTSLYRKEKLESNRDDYKKTKVRKVFNKIKSSFVH